MQMTAAGIKLIKEFESCKLTAYQCSAGVWTIGWGHTSMAGPPDVKPGMEITRKEADEILLRDLVQYERGVQTALKGVALPDNSYSACVSLAYNIGVGAFQRSSVARFIRAKRYDDAADAFLLWNRAGKRVLPGLTRRRAAEAALFRAGFAGGKEAESDRPKVDEPRGKAAFVSTTNIAATASAAAGVTAAVREVTENAGALISGSNLIFLLLMVVIIGSTLWIFRERLKKARDWGV